MTFCCLYQIISNNHLKHFKSLNFVQGHLMDKGLKVTYIHVSISNEWTKKQNLIQWREYIYFLIISQKKKHMAGYNNLLTHLLLPIVSIHFSLIILSTPSPPSIALQGLEKTTYYMYHLQNINGSSLKSCNLSDNYRIYLMPI